MNLWGIGGWELILIFLIALVAFGPGKLPEIAQTLGKSMRWLKRASTDFRVAIDREVNSLQDSSLSGASPPGQNPLAGEAPQNIAQSLEPGITKTEEEGSSQHLHEPR
jgi:sec-independent protein translocase protein TatA